MLQVTQVIDPASSVVMDAAKLKKDGCSGEVVFVEYDTVRPVQRVHDVELLSNDL